jgi:carbon monoxide dehydrogenase subunit G
MKVQLAKTFALPASADSAWVLLQEIERVAGCVPGARITERLDDRHYKGTMAVKFGPASMSFRGEVEVMALEPASKTLRMVGKGTDTTGSSGASMDLTARVEPIDGSSCRLLGTSEVTMSGKAAAFGSRMMSSVADQVLKQFGDNLTSQMQALRAQAPVPATGQGAASPEPQPPAPTQLNGLALVWAIVKDRLRSLFTAKRV